MWLNFFILTCFTNNTHNVANPIQSSNSDFFYNTKFYFIFTTREQKIYDVRCYDVRILVGETIHSLVGGLTSSKTTKISDSSVEVTNHSKVSPVDYNAIPHNLDRCPHGRCLELETVTGQLFETRPVPVPAQTPTATILYGVLPWIKYLQTHLIYGLTCQ